MSATLWKPDFDAYLTRLEDAPVSVVLDLNAAAHAPVDGHPHLLRIRIVMKTPDEHGLRSRVEFETLNDLEDSVLEALGPVVDGLHVGHMIHRGFIDLVLYCPPAVLAQTWEIDRLITEVRGEYEVEPIAQDDREWNFYREIMYPDPYDLQFILNRRLLSVIAESGDDLTASRPVDHLALFPDEAQAESAASALTAAGFAVKAPAVEDSEDGAPVWAVSFLRADALEGRSMDKVVAEVLDLILPLGGEYDGWECPVVKKKTSSGVAP